MSAYLGLFGAAFLAATLLPFYSEILVLGLANAGYDPFAIWAVATAGNTAGACVNWGLGLVSMDFAQHRWMRHAARDIERAQRWFQRYGKWSLLMTWLPVGGDALTFIAGIMRIRFPVFLVLTAAGKGARYAVLLLLTAPLTTG